MKAYIHSAYPLLTLQAKVPENSLRLSFPRLVARVAQCLLASPLGALKDGGLVLVC